MKKTEIDNTKEYRGFEDWEELYKKYKDLDMSRSDNQQNLCDDFYTISKLYFKDMFKREYFDSFISHLSDMWCSGYEFSDYTKEDYAKEALNRINYSSDRMNVNRWMHIRILLNKLID